METPPKEDEKEQVKPCYAYVLGSWSDCANGGSPRLYSGWTNNLEKRLAAHNAGKGAKATRGRVWQILHFEVFKTRGAAMSREAELKKILKTNQSLREEILARKN
ncbi:MAG: GIY-YIG nuclease family protein [Candidatus Micropelagos thuwalensis]